MSQLNVAQFLISQLVAWGVTRIYGVSGSETIPLFDAIAQHPEIELIPVRHESAAGFMAATEAKINGKLAVCITTSGPGLTNVLTGIADASQDHVPVLVLTGQIPTDKIGTHYKQYINQQAMFAELVLYTQLIAHANATSEVLLRSMQTAILQRGVTHLTIPLDIQEKMMSNSTITPYPDSIFQTAPQIDDIQCSNAIQALTQYKRPMICIGVGAKNAIPAIRQLAERIGAGVIASLGAKGMYPEEDEHFLGGWGDGGSDEAIEMLQEADLLLSIGSTWYPKMYIPKPIALIQIDTHAQNIALHQNPIHSVVGRAEDVVPKIIPDTSIADAQWKSKIHMMHQRYHERIAIETAMQNNRQSIHPAHLMGALTALLPETVILAIDTGEHTIWFNRYFTGMCKQVLFSGKWRSMGYALPAANTAQLLYPDETVVAIVGDGGFLMSLSECATTIRYNLPIKVIVMNNHALILEDRKSVKHGYKPTGTSLTNPDFVALAAAFGWQGRKIHREEDLVEAIQQMLSSNNPFMLEVELSGDFPKDLKPK